MKNYKIAVAGTGYVGLSLGVLFAQHHQVVAVDIVQAKVDMINNKKSPIQDDYIEKYLAEKDLELRGAGQLFGLRQHGLPDLYIADILQDIGVLIEARELAKKAFKNPQMLREIEDALSSQFDERFQRIFYS